MCCSKGLLAKFCSILGVEDFMRVPFPAAKIIAFIKYYPEFLLKNVLIKFVFEVLDIRIFQSTLAIKKTRYIGLRLI